MSSCRVVPLGVPGGDVEGRTRTQIDWATLPAVKWGGNPSCGTVYSYMKSPISRAAPLRNQARRNQAVRTAADSAVVGR